jgi:hypothetical protein
LLAHCHGGPSRELTTTTLGLPCYAGKGTIENRNGYLKCEPPR